jgi:hypothetical protein
MNARLFAPRTKKPHGFLGPCGCIYFQSLLITHHSRRAWSVVDQLQTNIRAVHLAIAIQVAAIQLRGQCGDLCIGRSKFYKIQNAVRV